METLIEVFNRYVEKGGEELVADRILELLGVHFQVHSLRWNSSDWKNENAPGLPGQLRRMFHNPDSARQLKQAIIETRPRAIVSHNIYPIGSPSLYRAAAANGIPVLQFTHNFRPFSVNGTLWSGDRLIADGLRGRFFPEVRAGSWQNSVVKSAVMAAVLKWQKASGAQDVVSRWIAISEFMRDTFVAAGLPADKVVVLRHFWEPTVNDTEPADEGYYLFLGRLVPEKGIRVLLEAWNLLEEATGSACPRLVVAGTGPLEAEVRAAVEVSGRIDYHGYVDGPAKSGLMRHARAFLAPSVWWEPLGLVTYEAYDHAKPMLAAASGGLKETVDDGRTGFIFEPGDPAALRDGVLKTEAMSESERRAMGAAGRKWLLAHASKERWLARFREILEDLS